MTSCNYTQAKKGLVLCDCIVCEHAMWASHETIPVAELPPPLSVGNVTAVENRKQSRV